jgi:hypothetical protein
MPAIFDIQPAPQTVRGWSDARGGFMVIEADAIKPIKPLTPDQSRKRSTKQVRVQQQMKDEGQRHAEKIRDLNARAS